MTLELVAAEAGVSKGGLLYHFASKRDLVAEMIDARWAEFDEAIAEQMTARPAGGGLAGAYVAACRCAATPTHLDTALLAAVFEDPAMARGCADSAATLHRRMRAEARDPALAAIVRLACDGLWLGELLALDVFVDDDRVQVPDRLSQLAEQATTGASAVEP